MRKIFKSSIFCIFIPPFGRKQEFSTVIDMVKRTNLDNFSRADGFAMPKLLDEPYSNIMSEELAEKMKK